MGWPYLFGKACFEILPLVIAIFILYGKYTPGNNSLFLVLASRLLSNLLLEETHARSHVHNNNY